MPECRVSSSDLPLPRRKATTPVSIREAVTRRRTRVGLHTREHERLQQQGFRNSSSVSTTPCRREALPSCADRTVITRSGILFDQTSPLIGKRMASWRAITESVLTLSQRRADAAAGSVT